MFDPKKMMEMMKNAYQMQQQMQTELASKRFEGVSGGGMVKVQMNGQFEVNEVKIDPSLVDQKETAFLEDMVKAAINDAVKQTQSQVGQQMKSMGSKLGIPL